MMKNYVDDVWTTGRLAGNSDLHCSNTPMARLITTALEELELLAYCLNENAV